MKILYLDQYFLTIGSSGTRLLVFAKTFWEILMRIGINDERSNTDSRINLSMVKE